MMLISTMTYMDNSPDECPCCTQIQALERQVNFLERNLGKVKETLQFYAEGRNWKSVGYTASSYSGVVPITPIIEYDKGKKARETLSEMEKETRG